MKLVIVEDHVMFRELLVRVCVRELGHDVVAETGSGAEALRLITDFRPEIALMDIVLSDGSGLDVIQKMKAAKMPTRFLVVSSHLSSYIRHQIVQAGADGCVDKCTDLVSKIPEALTAIASGRKRYGMAPAETGVNSLASCSFLKLLTQWECDILCFIGLGWSDLEIATRLDLSSMTVQSHRSHIMIKLGIKGTPKLIAFAAANGLLCGESRNRIPGVQNF